MSFFKVVAMAQRFEKSRMHGEMRDFRKVQRATLGSIIFTPRGRVDASTCSTRFARARPQTAQAAATVTSPTLRPGSALTWTGRKQDEGTMDSLPSAEAGGYSSIQSLDPDHHLPLLL